MSNTPTESEFDKELRDILFNASGGVSDMAEKEIMAIKKAAYKYALRVDLTALPHDELCLHNTAKYMIPSCAPCECDWAEKRLEQQLINLYGGDKK
ncbi:hypothetical protein MTX38_02855 [Rhodococcus sp. ARC_M13]|uniref:hypothetical protein n=1 Tax=Rhodococcus sp. ARC_M13 TaxID=2928855 RepID=UPI001FB40276|nr:hypothetical protein [Rhodococcus sp. ARC_M13]MCJ0895981.1 hypothetical protein [Rhodococcus sp. ARC_M13]